MQQFTNTQFEGLGIAALTICALASLGLAFFGAKRRLPGLYAAFLMAVVLRAICSISTDGAGYDMISYLTVGHTLASGIDIFTPPALFRQNYPPTTAWWFALASLVTPASNMHLFAAVAKLPFWLGDSLIVVVLGKIVPGNKGRLAAWFYALNPIAIAISSIHGQFDSLVVLAMLVGWGGLAGKGMGRGLLEGIAGAFKSWALLFLPVLWPRLGLKQSIRITGIALLVPVAMFAFYGLWFPQHLADGVGRMVGYVGTPQKFGSGSVLGPGQRLWMDLAIGSILAVIAVRGARKKFDIVYMLALSMLVVLSVSPVISVQYYVWPIAFMLAAGFWRTTVLLAIGVTPFLVEAEYLYFHDISSPVYFVVLARIAWLTTVVVTGYLWLRPRMDGIEASTDATATITGRAQAPPSSQFP